MGAIQAWLPEGTNLAGLAAFLAAMVLSFLAGYFAGRSARPGPAQRPASRPSPAPPRDEDPMRPLPAMDTEEARLMDLSAIRRAETEPPPRLGMAPPAPGAPTPRDASGAPSDQLRLPMAAHRPGSVPRQRPTGRPDKSPV